MWYSVKQGTKQRPTSHLVHWYTVPFLWPREKHRLQHSWMDFSQASAGYCDSQVLYSLIFCLETPKKSSGPTILAQVQHTLIRSISCELVSNFISCTPACSGTLYSPKVCQVEILFNAFLHFRTKGDIVLAAWINFRDTCLSQQIVTYFSGLSWVSVSWTHANIAYTSAWKTVQCFPREMLSLLPTDCPYTPTLVPSTVLDPSINQNSPLTTGEVSGPLVHSSVVNIVALYLGSSLKTGFIMSTPILNMGSDVWSRVNM